MMPPQKTVVRGQLGRTGLVAIALLCAVAVLGSGPALAQEGGDDSVELAGNGTAENPYVVTSVPEWNTINDDLDGHYVLGNDINASGFNREGPNSLQMIGEQREDTKQFAGTLDGQNHTIEIQEINNLVHLFVVNNGTIRDIRVDPGEMEYYHLPHRHSEAVVAAVNTGTLRNVTVTDANLSGEQQAGLVGENRGKIVDGEVRNVTFKSGSASGIAVVNRNGSIIGSDVVSSTLRGTDTASGIVEHNYNGTIADSSLIASRIEWGDDASGIVGHNHNGTIIGSRLINSTFGQDIKNAGGIVARDQNGTIRGVTVSGEIRGVNVGGIAGYANGTTLTNARVSGIITGKGRTFTERVETHTDKFSTGSGGVAGQATDAQIDRVRTTARVDGTTAGGMIGIANNTKISEAIIGGPIHGTVTGGSIGLTGSGKQNKLVAVYYDRNRTGYTANGNRTAIGLSTTEMMGSDVEAAMPELDFEETWVPTDGYPALRTDGDGEFRETVQISSVRLTDRVVPGGNTTQLRLTVKNLRPEQTVYRPEITAGNRSIETNVVVLEPDEQRTLVSAWNATEARTVPIRIDGNQYERLIIVLEPTPSLVEIDAPDRVAAGEQFTVSAVLENTADAAINTTVDYEAGNQTESRELSVGPDGSTVEFDLVENETGEITHTVTVRNESRTVSTEIREPPTADVSNVDVPESITADEEFTVEVTLTNTGGVEMTAPVTLEIGGETVNQREVSLPPGETTIELTHSIDDEGGAELRVETPGDQQTEEITVEADGGSQNGTDSADDSGPGFGILVAVLAALLFAGRARE